MRMQNNTRPCKRSRNKFMCSCFVSRELRDPAPCIHSDIIWCFYLPAEFGTLSPLICRVLANRESHSMERMRRTKKKKWKMPNKNHSVSTLLAHISQAFFVCECVVCKFHGTYHKLSLSLVNRCCATLDKKNEIAPLEMKNGKSLQLKYGIEHVARTHRNIAVLRCHGRNHLLRKFTLRSQTANIN